MFSSKQYARLCEISGLLNIPIKDLEDIFTDTEGESEIDIITSYFNNKFILSTFDEDPLSFFRQYINPTLLYIICADYNNFYIGLNTFQACKIIIGKILHKKNSIGSINGYPSNLNYNGNNNVQKYSDSNINCLPLKAHSVIGKSNYNSIINSSKFINAVNKTEDEILLYHACNYDSMDSILAWIDPTFSRQEPTDFGRNNFYTTDSFKAAFLWSSRYSRGSIIVFKIPKNLIEILVEEDKKIEFNHTNIDSLNFWKQFVFQCRKVNAFGIGRNSQLSHRNYITEVDRYEFISGPILANIDISSFEEADYISYSREIPYQLSFKSQRICDILHGYICLLLPFEELF